MPRRVVIVGGGLGGLATAWWLHRRAPDTAITILEANATLGGLLGTCERAGCVLELGADAFLAKPAMLDLIASLGLDEQIIRVAPEARRALVVRNNALHPVPAGTYLVAPGRAWPILRSPLLSWRGRLRMLCEPFVPRRKRDDDEETLAQFIRRRFGAEALSWLAQPLAAGITTANPERLSVRTAFPRLVAMERVYGSVRRAIAATTERTASGARYDRFVALAHGTGSLVDALSTALRQRGVTITCDAPATQIAVHDGGWRISTPTAQYVADAVALAIPTHAIAQLAGTWSPAIAALATIEHAGVVLVNLVYDAAQVPPPPQAAGVVIPHAAQLGVIALTCASRKFAGRAADGRHVVRAFIGGALDPDALALDDAALIARVRAVCAELFAWRTAPIDALVTRWPRSMPQLGLGHRRLVAAAHAAVPVHAALIAPGLAGVGMPDIVAQAQHAAERLA